MTIKTALHRDMVVAIVAATAIFVFFILFFEALRQNEQLTTQAETPRAQADLSARIEAHIAARLETAGAFQRRWRSGQITSLDAFRDEAEAIESLFGDFQAINWVDESGVIRWATPLAGNEAALGLDLNTLDRPAAAMRAARESGRVSLTPAIDLAQGGLGVAGCAPLNRGVASDGFINLIFRIDPLVDGAIGAGLPTGHRLSISDGHREIFARGDENGASGEQAVRSIMIADRSWSVRLTPPQTTAAAGAKRRRAWRFAGGDRRSLRHQRARRLQGHKR